jgi:hypothetical protein
MELKWEKVSSSGPGPIFVAKSAHDDRNRYEIAGTEGYWYGTYYDLSNTKFLRSWNLGWSPSLELMKSHCLDIDEYLSL